MAQAFEYPVPDPEERTVFTASSVLSKIAEYKNASSEDYVISTDFQTGYLLSCVFENVEIRGKLNLAIPELNGILPPVFFKNCIFTHSFWAELLSIESINFVDCTFQGYFSVAESTVMAARFHKCKFNRQSLFPYTIFENQVFFKHCDFVTARFEGCIFKKQIMFDHCSISKKLCLTRTIVDSSALSFCNMPIENIQIAHFDIQKLNYQRIIWPAWSIINPDNKLTEDICRAWKVKARSVGDEALASNWHMLEKQYSLERVKEEKNWFLLFLLFCYRQLSMYGESPARALVWIAIFLLLPFLPSLAGQCSVDYVLAGIPVFSKAAPPLWIKSTKLKVFGFLLKVQLPCSYPSCFLRFVINCEGDE